MTVLIVVAMFAVILLIDHAIALHQKKSLVIAAEPQPQPLRPRLLPSVIAGFEVMDNVRYHPGHTWALSESPKLVRVGIDDFAAKLAGKVDRITLPTPGQWVRQGQKIFTIMRDGKETALVSPIEGAVAEVNQAVVSDPEIARRDPYGEGWLVTVDSPDAKTNFRNLLGGMLARRWMDDAATRLRALIATPVGATVQDGGIAIDDLVSRLPEQEWEKVTKEFFLT